VTGGKVIQVDVIAGRCEVDGAARRVCAFDPLANLPMVDRCASRLVLGGAADLDSDDMLSLLREARRVLDFGGVLELEGPAARATARSLDPTDPESGADRLARYAGLKLQSTGPTWTLLRACTESPGPYPLVSILVPGYRPTYLDETLNSAREQTWQNVEILVGDDSRGDEVRNITTRHSAADPRVRYIGEVPEHGSLANHYHLLSESKGSYVKILNDDDLLDPDCVERMARCLAAFPHVSLVTSHRRKIDSGGRLLEDDSATARRVGTDSIIDGASAAGDVLRLGYNWIGEPTTTMFRATAIDTPTPFGVGDQPARASGDLALWLKLLGRGDLVYLTDTLSSFRQHEGQRQKQEEFLEIAEAAQDQTFAVARSLGLDQPRTAPFIATPIAIRPWWPERARELVAGLTTDNAHESLAALQRELDDDMAMAVLRAHVALNDGDAETAVTVLDQALENNPTAVEAIKLMAIALLHLDAFEMAHKMLWLAHKICPHDEDTAATKAALEEALGQRVPA
jgi:hypothetical protein